MHACIVAYTHIGLHTYIPPTYIHVHPSIHPLIHGLNARRCPMSPHFLNRRVSRLLGLALVSWACARVGVYRPSLRLPYLVFSIRCYLPLDFNRISLRPTYLHPFGRPFMTPFLVEFPGFGLALLP